MGGVIEIAAGLELRCWAALGDSLTAGHVTGERTWVDDVSGRLELLGLAPEIYNLARTGARAQDVERDQLPAALKADPDLVTLFCGGNDVLLSVRPDLRAFADAYDGIAARIRRELPEANVLVATYPELGHMLPLRERARERVAKGLVGVNAVIRGVARRHDLGCLDFARLVEHSDGSIFDADGVHPSPLGKQLAAGAFGDAIEKLLGDERGGRR